MYDRYSKTPAMSNERAKELLAECQDTIDSGGNLPESILQILWKQRVEGCAFTLSEAILRKILNEDDCGTVTVEELASALWLKEWLGDSQWDGTGRVSGG